MSNNKILINNIYQVKSCVPNSTAKINWRGAFNDSMLYKHFPTWAELNNAEVLVKSIHSYEDGQVIYLVTAIQYNLDFHLNEIFLLPIQPADQKDCSCTIALLMSRGCLCGGN